MSDSVSHHASRCPTCPWIPVLFNHLQYVFWCNISEGFRRALKSIVLSRGQNWLQVKNMTDWPKWTPTELSHLKGPHFPGRKAKIHREGTQRKQGGALRPNSQTPASGSLPTWIAPLLFTARASVSILQLARPPQQWSSMFRLFFQFVCSGLWFQPTQRLYFDCLWRMTPTAQSCAHLSC